MTWPTIKLVAVLGLLACLGGPAAGAATLRSLVSEGNERYLGKEYDEALKRYRLAAEQDPESFHASFNLGAALYRTGEFTQAIGSFQHAAQMAREKSSAEDEALARYNLGNAFFRASDADARTNPRVAIDSLEKSVESYRQALALNPELADAGHNIALARRRMKELLEMMRNAPAGGESRDDQEQLQQELEDNLRKQNELTEQREQLEQQEKNQQASPEQVEQQSQRLAEQQQELEQRSRELAEQLDKPQSSPEQKQAQDQLEQAAEQQRQAAEQMSNQQLEQAEGAQQQARQRLEDALASLGGDPNQGGEPQPAHQPGSGQPQQPPQELQALEQSPQDILNEERSNRQRRRMLLLGAQAQVEKDW